MEELIGFKTAKLAKEKGFKEPCLVSYYGSEKELGTSHCYDLMESKKRTPDNEIYAPTQSLLQKWLRNNFAVHIKIIWVDTLGSVWCYHISTTGNAIRPKSKFYDSYEEALEAGLQQALNLI